MCPPLPRMAPNGPESRHCHVALDLDLAQKGNIERWALNHFGCARQSNHTAKRHSTHLPPSRLAHVESSPVSLETNHLDGADGRPLSIHWEGRADETTQNIKAVGDWDWDRTLRPCPPCLISTSLATARWLAEFLPLSLCILLLLLSSFDLILLTSRPTRGLFCCKGRRRQRRRRRRGPPLPLPPSLARFGSQCDDGNG